MERFAKEAAVGRAFSPASPITDRDMFAGRQAKLMTLARIVGQRGQHALIYGERGVGKTSLARVVQAIHQETYVAPYYVCDSSSNFASIWSGVFREINVVSLKPGLGFNSEPKQIVTNALSLMGTEPDPQSVAQALTVVTNEVPMLAIIDEFDRPTDAQTRTQIADTIKILADRGVPATVILVGVADTVEELLSEHLSVQRCLAQVQMPRMADDELREVVLKGMTAAELTVESSFVKEVVELSQGLPHYTHLLSYHGGIHALEDNRTNVRHSDFQQALGAAMDAASQSVRQNHHRATYSNRETLYNQVLLACAMANKDDLGSFGAPDVRDMLRKITEKGYDIPAFAAHLKDFSADAGPRGNILQRIGTTRRFRYRFRDPLMPPYVLMKGRAQGLI
jgi:Cdc6-like AAA superfamily ATPase